MSKYLICLSRATPGRALPEEILLIPAGRVDYTKDGKVGSFLLSPECGEQIITEFKERGKDLVIDYEHQSLSGGKAPAAGWIHRLELRDGGLYGLVKYWSDEARSYLEKGEYRYYSPTILFEDGKPVSLHSVALTNHPYGNTFSTQDVKTFIDNKLKKMVVVTENGVYTLTRKEAGVTLNAKEIVERYDTIASINGNKFDVWKEVLNGSGCEIVYSG